MSLQPRQAPVALDAAALSDALDPAVAHLISRLDVLPEVDSTSAYLLRSSPPPPGTLAVCVAERQTAGRGRRGRGWTTPPGGGLALSAAWRFAATPGGLSALPLAVGVAAKRAIERLTGVAIQLKWPNDLVWDGRKLGGILLDHVADSRGGGCMVAIGIGINVAMPPESLAAVSDWPRGAVDLSQATNGAPPRMAALAASLLTELARLLSSFATCGGADHLREFSRADWLDGRSVSVAAPGGEWTGVARGVAPDGALQVETADGTYRRVLSGDVSIRWAP